MEKNKNPQNEPLREEQLEDVAGGENRAKNCFFEPNNPPVHKVENGRLWVKCKSICSIAVCQCRDNTERCVDRWHIAEQANPGLEDGKWYASPKGSYNHNEDRKLIKNVFVKL